MRYIKGSKLFLVILPVMALLTGCPSQDSGVKECSELAAADCEKPGKITGKICLSFPGGICKQITKCQDIKPLGQPKCDVTAVNGKQCEWKAGDCVVKSILRPSALITDFQSQNRKFTADKAAIAGAHGEVEDVFQQIIDGTQYLQSATFEFKQGKNEVVLSGVATYSGTTKAFDFTYDVEDVDADTMWVRLASTVADKKGTGAVNGINLIEAFTSAKILYPKASNKLLSVVCKTKADVDQIVFDKAADFRKGRQASDTPICTGIEFNQE